MEEEKFKRQEGLVLPDSLLEPITIIGAGGIGSWTALYLSKIGCRTLTVFDGDKVEEHNLPSQFYAEEDIGKNKVEALRERVREFSGVEIGVVPKNYSHEPLGGVVILAVDKMETRRELAEDGLSRGFWKLLIDGRMGGDQIEIYTVRSVQEYVKTLVPLSDVETGPCTERSVVYNTAIIGGLITNQVKKFAKGDKLHPVITVDLYNLVVATD